MTERINQCKNCIHWIDEDCLSEYDPDVVFACCNFSEK